MDQELERVDTDPEMQCDIQGPGIMYRKPDEQFLDWFNQALIRLKKSTQYKSICEDIEVEHGKCHGYYKLPGFQIMGA